MDAGYYVEQRGSFFFEELSGTNKKATRTEKNTCHNTNRTEASNNNNNNKNYVPVIQEVDGTIGV